MQDFVDNLHNKKQKIYNFLEDIEHHRKYKTCMNTRHRKYTEFQKYTKTTLYIYTKF